MRFPMAFFVTALVVGIAFLADIAMASPARRKPEVFRAVEGEAEGPRHASDPGETSISRGMTRESKPAQEIRPEVSIAYEIVPEKERPSFERRLELAERLIMEASRAYDYRTTTSQELQDALKSLSALQ
jgi:hypothetical protein